MICARGLLLSSNLITNGQFIFVDTELGILRLLLAVGVLLSHCPKGSITLMHLHPAAAVQCFYLVSGFLIQFAIRRNYQGKPGWHWRFYASRFFRIYPLYALFFVLTIGLLGASHFSYYVSKHEWGISLLWLLNNIFIIGQDALRFFYLNLQTWHLALLPSSDAERAAVEPVTGSLTLLGQSWTLALELYFYLLAPLVLTRRTRVLLLLVSLLVGLRVYLCYHGFFLHNWVGFFPNELAVFLLGSLACRAYFLLFETGWIARVCGGERVLFRVSVTVVLIVSAVYIVMNEGFHPGHWYAPPLGVPMGYILVLLMTLAALPFAFHVSRAWRFDRFLGELSYPIYISHMLILDLIVQRLGPEGAARRYIGPLVLVICLLLSAVLIRLVEQPIDRWRHRRFSRPSYQPYG